MRKPNWRAVLVVIAMNCAAPTLFTTATQAGGVDVKARLSSANASEEVSGSLRLNGYDLTGHLSGGGVDVTIAGTVKSSSVEVEVTGHIVPSCNLNRQTMSGEAKNNGASTSVALSFVCTTKASSIGGEDYLFHLDLNLPPLHPVSPGNGDPGEDAAIDLLQARFSAT